ncbi:HNH endonuclease signature motif containing protein [Nonomuraea rosea]
MRTIKPEFWEDDVVGSLSREARLLFIATWNAADDEGLLRWTAAYLKAQAFIYDDDIGIGEVELLMQELVDADLVFPYQGGRIKQQLACIIKFHKHQRVNRPQPSKLPAPSLQNARIAEMYGRRDGWACHICGGDIEWPGQLGRPRDLELDHVHPRSKGGSDYPSNIRAAHGGCNASKKDRIPDSVNGSVSDSVNDSRNRSRDPAEEFTAVVVKGRGVVKEQKTSEAPPTDDPPRLDVERLCNHLADRIATNGSKRPVITKKWRDAARLLIDKDGRAEEQVHAAIDWCQDSEFWRANILSLPTLRDQYDRLRLQASTDRGRDSPDARFAPNSGSRAPVPTADEIANGKVIL